MNLTDDGSLILSLRNSAAITYRMERDTGSVVIREVKSPSGENREQEVFRMLDTARCEFKIKDSPDRVTLELDSEIPGEVGLKRVEMRVTATANRWPKVTVQLGAKP